MNSSTLSQTLPFMLYFSSADSLARSRYEETISVATSSIQALTEDIAALETELEALEKELEKDTASAL